MRICGGGVGYSPWLLLHGVFILCQSRCKQCSTQGSPAAGLAPGLRACCCTAPAGSVS